MRKKVKGMKWRWALTFTMSELGEIEVPKGSERAPFLLCLLLFFYHVGWIRDWGLVFVRLDQQGSSDGWMDGHAAIGIVVIDEERFCLLSTSARHALFDNMDSLLAVVMG